MPHLSLLKTLSAVTVAALTVACAGTPQGGTMAGSPSADAAAQLQAYHWDLRAAFDAQGQQAPGWLVPGRTAARLQFQDRRLAVQNLCNVLGAGYTLDGRQLKIERPISTMRACAEPGLMELERRVATQLPQATAYALQPSHGGTAAPLLVLRFAGGERWELAGTPTPATRYGSAGERIFLEVAPQRVPCNHPLMRDAMCLQVRDLHFDAQGLKQSVGEWRVFQGEIEGYRHEPGIRNVLRLQRYVLARNGQLPADGPSHAHVLDMVVESERVR